MLRMKVNVFSRMRWLTVTIKSNSVVVYYYCNN